MRTKVCAHCGDDKELEAFALARHCRTDGRQSWCRDCHRIRHRETYQRNREELIAKAAAWNRANPDRHAASKKKHRDKTRDLNAQRSREWRLRNPGRTRAIKQWVKENPDRVRMYAIWRRERKARNGGFCTVEQLQARWDFYGGRCWMCAGEATAIDHVIPVSRGGTSWPANLRPACRSCNSRKRDRLPGEMAA